MAYPFAVKASFFDEKDEITRTLHLLIYADSMREAAAMVEKYCDPEDLELHCVSDEVQLFEVAEDDFYAAILGNGDLISGRLILKQTEEDQK